MNCPCKDCKDRTAVCHSLCEKYKPWKAELDEINRARAKELAAKPLNLHFDRMKRKGW